MSNLMYKFTFEDGSETYLEHHGVKGMHWGEWNSETAARYRGGNSSVSGAKKTVRQLNALDKRKAIETGKEREADKQADRYLAKAEKSQQRGNTNAFMKNVNKSLKYTDKATSHMNAKLGIEKTQKDLLNKVKKEGYTVSMKDVRRSTLTNGEKALQIALNGAAAAAGSPVLAMYNKTTPGTKYKLENSRAERQLERAEKRFRNAVFDQSIAQSSAYAKTSKKLAKRNPEMDISKRIDIAAKAGRDAEKRYEPKVERARQKYSEAEERAGRKLKTTRRP